MTRRTGDAAAVAALTVVRDVALIVLAVESIVLGVLLAVLIVRLLAFMTWPRPNSTTWRTPRYGAGVGPRGRPGG